MSNYTVVMTGGIGSGKSTVAQRFQDHGIVVIEQDEVSRLVVEPGEPALTQIINQFGNAVAHEDGSLNRQALRDQVFRSAEDRRWLERLLHPLIGQRTRQLVEQADSPYCIVVNPLLRSRSVEYDRILVVDVPIQVQIERTVARDGVPRQQAESIVDVQIGREDRLALADDVIENDGIIDHIDDVVYTLHQEYLTYAHEKARQRKTTLS